MPVYKGTRYVQNFTFTQKATGDPIDISSWEFTAHLRDQPDDEAFLAELTTANEGFVTIDGANGRLSMVLTPEVTDDLPESTIHFDVLRTDQVTGPTFLFSGKFKVKTPVTQL